MKIYSAEIWNAMIDRLARFWPLGVEMGTGGTWAHPWRVSPSWDGIAEQWRATVAPGFVNGREVTVNIERSTLNIEQLNQIPGSMLDVQSSMLNVPLTMFPAFPLGTLRRIGGSAEVDFGTAGEAVPPFFAALGVKSAQTITAESLELGEAENITEAKLAGIEGGTSAADLPERLLRAVDLVLRHTRAVNVIAWDLTPAETGAQAQFTVTSLGPSRGVASLHTVARFDPIAPPDDLDKLRGLSNDPGFDEIKVATVFLLSPPDAALDAEPDGTWSVYVQHALFWNVGYITTGPALAAPQNNITLNLAGLGAAAGAQLTVNQLLSTSNDATAAALQFLTAREIRGHFFTPGARLPAEQPAADALDPPFPFFGLPFDPAFLK